MLVLHVAHALQDTTPDGVAQVLRSSLRVNITQVDGAVKGLRYNHSTKAVRREGHVGCQRRCEALPIGLERRERRCGRLCDERLRSSSLRGLRCGLLRLGDVGTAVLAIVDALARPGRLCR